MAFLDRIPWAGLIVAAVLLGIAPVFPEPHLVEKARWLATGQPMRPIDWFDILFHAFPLILVALKLARARRAD